MQPSDISDLNTYLYEFEKSTALTLEITVPCASYHSQSSMQIDQPKHTLLILVNLHFRQAQMMHLPLISGQIQINKTCLRVKILKNSALFVSLCFL